MGHFLPLWHNDGFHARKESCPFAIKTQRKARNAPEFENTTLTGTVYWPDGPLTTVALSLPVTDATGLAQGDTAGRAGPVAQGAPEPCTDQAGGDQQSKHRGQRATKHSPHYNQIVVRSLSHKIVKLARNPKNPPYYWEPIGIVYSWYVINKFHMWVVGRYRYYLVYCNTSAVDTRWLQWLVWPRHAVICTYATAINGLKIGKHGKY